MLSYSVVEVNIKAILPDKVEHNVSTSICFKLGVILEMRTSTHLICCKIMGVRNVAAKVKRKRKRISVNCIGHE